MCPEVDVQWKSGINVPPPLGRYTWLEANLMADQIPVAQYLRMSTEHQRYSLENQQSAIHKYAEDHGFSVVQTYADRARSGLVLRNRPVLRELLHDVTRGTVAFKAILVYD